MFTGAAGVISFFATALVFVTTMLHLAARGMPPFLRAGHAVGRSD